MSEAVIRKQYVYTSEGRKLLHPETSASAIPDLYEALEAFYANRGGSNSFMVVSTMEELEEMAKSTDRLYCVDDQLFRWDGTTLIALGGAQDLSAVLQVQTEVDELIG